MAEDDYRGQLNAWHLELAIVQDLVSHLLTELDGPDWMRSAAHLARSRLEQLVESCPISATQKSD